MTNEDKIVATGAGLMLFGIMIGGSIMKRFNNGKQKRWDSLADVVVKDNSKLRTENTNLKKQLNEKA